MYTVRAENVHLTAEFSARARHPPTIKIVQYEIKCAQVTESYKIW